MKFYDELKYRGLIDNISSVELIDKLNNGGLTFYIGTDPTGDSLHIGHYCTVIALAKRFMDAGHNPIVLIGGGTGLVGDPRATKERDIINKNTVLDNVDSLSKQIKKYLCVPVVNNYDWIKDISAIDFLRDYGKYFNVSYMLAKDTVKRRLDTGITYTEFSYMILQSLDFLHLYEEMGVSLQIGGSDQWGNLTSGLELIRKKHENAEVFALTSPLVLRADGSKFGKSEDGKSLWLDEDKTSPYEFYQYLINSEDEMVITYLKRLSFLSVEEIKSLEISLKEHPEERKAQKALAYDVVKFLHGEESANKARDTSEAVFSGNLDNQDIDVVIIDNKNINIIDALISTSLCSSRSDARRLIEQGGIKVDGNTINDVNEIIDLSTSKVIKKGKKVFIRLEGR
ncbi:MAG: tyrosine--tRNA ligase [Bacilli bacterium]